MKKKTLNAQRPMLNIQRLGVSEDAASYGSDPPTLNVQRSMFNVQRQKAPRFDLELRCGTSPYGDHGEVQAAESRRWLRLIQRTAWLPQSKTAPIFGETEQLIKIFFSSIRTAQSNA